jgi:hypothetical protein
MSAIATTRIDEVPDGELVRLPTPRTAPGQRILAVEFASLDGRTWTAIGGGETVAAAIADAREGCPDDTVWHPIDWDDLYGE